MTYLARGLTSGSPGPGRFVLTPPGDDTRWENLALCRFTIPHLSRPDYATPSSQLLLALGQNSAKPVHLPLRTASAQSSLGSPPPPRKKKIS